MVLAHDEAVCFSASEYGHLFMFEMLGEGSAARERARRKEEEGGGVETDTVLVSKGELHDLTHCLHSPQLHAWP